MTSTGTAPPTPTTRSTHRDPSVDLLRAMALGIVVLGHWFLAVVHWNGGRLEAANLLDVAPATQWATWLFQPMPLFFAVGGWAAARSWSRRGAGRDATGWVGQRLVRLLVPTATYVVVTIVVVAGIVATFGATAAAVRGLLGMHLWFLAVYLPVTACMPWMCRLIERHSWRVPCVAAGLVVTVDVARFVGHVPGVGWANFAFLWLGFAALGAAAAIRPPATHGLVRVASVALAVLVGVVAAGWYPHSMVGAGDRSNNTPPTVALGLLGLVEIALAARVAPRLRSWLERRTRARRAVATMGTFGMHLYLWHLYAVVIVAAVLRTGWGNLEPMAAGWWATRPVWWAVLTLVATPIVVVAARLGGRRIASLETRPSTRSGRVVAATLAATVACAALALGGLRPGWSAVLAVTALLVARRLVTRPTADTSPSTTRVR